MIEDVRRHLAAHDRRLVFLFGAGTSSSITTSLAAAAGGSPKTEPLIPGVEGLTELCRLAVSSLGARECAAWGALLKQCIAARRPGNVESVLSNVRMKIDAVSEGETLLGLDINALAALEKTICTSIARAACPSDEAIPERTPHADFAAWVRKVTRTVPLEIFTTNYDVLLERALEEARIPVFDGFVGTRQPFFYPECLEEEALLPPPRWLRLWKVHGSVNWGLETVAGAKRIVKRQPSQDGEMILPSHRKYDESRKQPYAAYMDRLARMVNTEHALLVSCGYSFRDDHINAILYAALENRNTANVISLQFGELRETDSLVDAARHRSNLTVIGTNGGVISRTWGEWRLTQPVDKKTWSFMDVVFDSDAQIEGDGSSATRSAGLTGRMRLGDFKALSRFLREMGPDIA